MRKQAGDWKGTLSREAKEHPGRTVAMALGAGFLLGGGLFSRLTARLLRLGARVGVRAVLVPVVAQGIVGFRTARKPSSMTDTTEANTASSGT